MKIRQGFISNSSSSSFIVCLKKGYTKEQIKENNLKKLKKYGFVKEEFDNILKKFKNEYILVYDSVEYGSEESSKNICKTLLTELGYNNSDFNIY